MVEGDDSGRPRETTTDDVLAAFEEISAPVATGTELAQLLGVSQQTILRRLAELHEDERVKRKEVGARAVVWWPEDEE
ncbi:HTH domain-containing protein [Natronococcus jeotgali]|uniref:HTH domain-containing protein n=1 Tax=Natronococcus jeotgali TaxID=413812 RepID=UPI0009FD6022|nr:HTH domain-containing protein [Natronococcus jeotgali]